MCRFCLSRRALLAAPAILALTPTSTAMAGDEAIEPCMRLANPPADRLTVALPLDACPGGFDERIATALVESGIPATIFVTELWLRRNPAGLAFLLEHRDLFGIENHGKLHIPPVLGNRSIFGIPVAGDLAAVQREVTEGAAARYKRRSEDDTKTQQEGHEVRRDMRERLVVQRRRLIPEGKFLRHPVSRFFCDCRRRHVL
jgi:peptidoglycan/xylan/chitin deacetylase (PgdA/CDA1 family)